MADVKMTVRHNGPILVEGNVDLVDADGNPIAIPRNPFALCRCGASANKPFCDGMHGKIGFDAAKEVASESKE